MTHQTVLLGLLTLLTTVGAVGCRRPSGTPVPAASAPSLVANSPDDRVRKSDAEWKKALTSEQFHVLREKGTEAPFSGAYHDAHGPAVYVCAACGQKLFDSDHKFDSGTGWPSFYQPIASKSVEESVDSSLGTTRTEVTCRRCGGHLGHVFEDGPKPTGLRYCINSAALAAVEKR